MKYGADFELKALELVAKRVSAVSGDMRAAMFICNTARGLRARGQRSALSTLPQAVPQGSSTADQSGSHITVSDVAAALKQCSSGGSAQACKQVAAIQGLPAQQQLLVCTMAIARSGAAPPRSEPSTPTLQPGSRLASQPLSAHFPILSSLGKGRHVDAVGKAPGTPVLQHSRGFGLAGTPPLGKSVNKAFPRADDDTLVTPTSAYGTPKTAGSPAARKADLSIDEVWSRYKAAAREAGLAQLSLQEVKAMLSALQVSGLLEAQTGKERYTLAVGTTDVKHALAETRMLQVLVDQLH